MVGAAGRRSARARGLVQRRRRRADPEVGGRRARVGRLRFHFLSEKGFWAVPTLRLSHQIRERLRFRKVGFRSLFAHRPKISSGSPNPPSRGTSIGSVGIQGLAYGIMRALDHHFR